MKRILKSSSTYRKEANIYIFPDFSDDDLYELAEDLMMCIQNMSFSGLIQIIQKEEIEQTPVPVIIQQDRKTLEILRGNQPEENIKLILRKKIFINLQLLLEKEREPLV